MADRAKVDRAIFALVLVVFLSRQPSGPLHFYLSWGVYFRDVLMIALVGWLAWSFRQALLAGKAFVPLAAIAVGTGLMLLSGLARFIPRIDALLYTKQAIFWTTSLLTGFWFASLPPKVCTRFFKTMLLCFGVYMIAEIAVGYYEYSTQTVLFSELSGEATATGVDLFRIERMEDIWRIKGLQRDIFGFAHLMGITCVVSVTAILNIARTRPRVLGSLFLLAAGALLGVAGGRSAVMGAMGAIAALAAERVLAIISPPSSIGGRFGLILAGTFVAGLMLSIIGISPVVGLASELFFADKAMGNLESTFLREELWRDSFFAPIYQIPHLLFSGELLGGLVGRNGPGSGIFDNIYFWLLYKFGLGGLAALVVVLIRGIVLMHRHRLGRLLPYYCGLVAFVLTEGIARDSIFYEVSGPILAMIGYAEGIAARWPVPWRRRPNRPAVSTIQARQQRLLDPGHSANRPWPGKGA